MWAVSSRKEPKGEMKRQPPHRQGCQGGRQTETRSVPPRRSVIQESMQPPRRRILGRIGARSSSGVPSKEKTGSSFRGSSTVSSRSLRRPVTRVARTPTAVLGQLRDRIKSSFTRHERPQQKVQCGSGNRQCAPVASQTSRQTSSSCASSPSWWAGPRREAEICEESLQ